MIKFQSISLRSGLSAAILFGLTLAVSIGCTPDGSTGGRIDPYRTTEADYDSSRASMPSMLEFSDQVAAALAYDLADIPEVQNSPTKLVLELGDMENHTRTPYSDFMLIQRRVQNQLLSSNVVKNQFILVEGPARMDLEKQRVTSNDSSSARYDAGQTFMLMGDFFESNRVEKDRGGDVRRYYFTFKLVNLQTRQIVFSNDYDLAQLRD